MDDGDLTLTSIGEGIVEELYDDGLQKILANIADEDTSQKRVRKLVLEFSFEPNDETEELDIHITSRVSLVPKKGRRAKAYMFYHGGKRGLTSLDPKQQQLPFPKASGESS